MPIIVAHNDPSLQAAGSLMAGMFGNMAQNRNADLEAGRTFDLQSALMGQRDQYDQAHQARSMQQADVLRTMMDQRKQDRERAMADDLERLSQQPEYKDKAGVMRIVAAHLRNGVEPHPTLIDMLDPAGRNQATIAKTNAQAANIPIAEARRSGEAQQRLTNQGLGIQLRGQAEQRRAANDAARLAETQRHNQATEQIGSKNAENYQRQGDYRQTIAEKQELEAADTEMRAAEELMKQVQFSGNAQAQADAVETYRVATQKKLQVLDAQQKRRQRPQASTPGAPTAKTGGFNITTPKGLTATLDRQQAIRMSAAARDELIRRGMPDTPQNRERLMGEAIDQSYYGK